MWDHAKVLPFGRLSIRNMWIFAAAMLVATFMYVWFASPTAHAVDAEWNGDTIVYAGKTYDKIATAKAGDSHNLPAGTLIYRYIEPSTSSPGTPTTKAHLIYFAPGTDPATATKGEYAVYNYTDPDIYKNPSGKASITLTPQAPASAGETSCVVDGIGWIVCPITSFLASAMDHLFDILASFLTVRPVQTNQENALYRAWSYMRSFANVSFVIAFLIIIYSQLTSVGLSNYDIKKMLPRLIVAAILVNISYWICAIAIDVSNILGWSIQEVFISMRNGLVGSEGNSWEIGWEDLGGFVLSGGTAAVAAGASISALMLSAGSVGAAIYMLLPVLVGVIIAVLVAILVMAARQAIITVLLIISPLAFVAYLLPNTEKYYAKWQQLGITMLLLFPIFSVIFGGSQLAGKAIIQNADSINLFILGMAVQVAPVVVTPLLVKFSGSLLARIGGMVNNPGKGLIDRTRKFAEERRDQRKAEVFASPLNRKRRDFIARSARNMDTKRRAREGWQKANEATADANWANSKEYSNIQQKNFSGSALKDTGEANAETRYEASKRTDSAVQDLDINARASKLRLDLSKAETEADWDEIKAGDSRRMVEPVNLTVDALASYAHTRNNLARSLREDTIGTAVEARRSQSAQHVQKHQFSSALQASQELRVEAGGIDSNGAQRALANALREQHEQRGEAVKNANSIIHHSNLSDSVILDVALNRAKPTDVTFEITEDVQEAAIKMVAGSKNVGNINTLTENINLDPDDPKSVENHRIAFANELRDNSARPKYISSSQVDEMQQGIKKGGLLVPGLDKMIIKNIVDDKFSPEALVQQDKYALIRMADAIRRNKASYKPHELQALTELKGHINEVYASDILRVKVGERKDALQDLLNL